MKAQNAIHPSESVNLLSHPILWLRNFNKKQNTRRQMFSSPYIIHLPVLPSALYFMWQKMASQHKSAHIEGRIFRYTDDKGQSFSALLEVDRWQGVFCLDVVSDKNKQQLISSLEFWGLALREHGNTEDVIDNSNAQGAVFWHDNTLHVYPAQLGVAFEDFLRKCLLPTLSE